MSSTIDHIEYMDSPDYPGQLWFYVVTSRGRESMIDAFPFMGKTRVNREHADKYIAKLRGKGYEVRQVTKAAAPHVPKPKSQVDSPIQCPKCGSTQVTAQKKGFSTGKALVGGVALGVVGLAAGAIGSGKVMVTCLRCGHSWAPGHR